MYCEPMPASIKKRPPRPRSTNDRVNLLMSLMLRRSLYEGIYPLHMHEVQIPWLVELDTQDNAQKKIICLTGQRFYTILGVPTNKIRKALAVITLVLYGWLQPRTISSYQRIRARLLPMLCMLYVFFLHLHIFRFAQTQPTARSISHFGNEQHLQFEGISNAASPIRYGFKLASCCVCFFRFSFLLKFILRCFVGFQRRQGVLNSAWKWNKMMKLETLCCGGENHQWRKPEKESKKCNSVFLNLSQSSFILIFRRTKSRIIFV